MANPSVNKEKAARTEFARHTTSKTASPSGDPSGLVSRAVTHFARTPRDGAAAMVPAGVAIASPHDPLTVCGAPWEADFQALQSMASAEVDHAVAEVNNIANTPAAVPAVAEFAAPAAPGSPPLPAEDPETTDMRHLSTLRRHEDRLGDSIETGGNLNDLIAAEDTPPDLREALIYLRDNKAFSDRIDTAKGGGSPDGKLAKDDFQAAADDPRFIEFSRDQAKTYKENYVPSDATGESLTPQPMTTSDASRELYLYSDELGDFSQENLQGIVDGTNRGGKCPPQVIAAAQYFLDNPAEFAKIAPDGDADREELQKNAGFLINLRPEELAAIDSVQSNKAIFLKDGNITRDSLQSLVNDETVPPEVRDAAMVLLNSPVVFGMLDNAEKGYDGKFKLFGKSYKGNDGQIGGGDIDAIGGRLTAQNKTPAKPVAIDTGNPQKPYGNQAARADALNDMLAGMQDDPDIKKPVESKTATIVSKTLGIVARVVDVVKLGLDVVSGFLPPPFGQIVAGVGLLVAAGNQFGVKAFKAMADGQSADDAYKQAGKDFGIEAAESAVSMVPGAGAVKAAYAGVKAGVKVGVKVAVSEGVSAGARQGIKAGMKEGGEVAARHAAEKATRQAAKSGAGAVASEGAEAAAGRGAREGAGLLAEQAASEASSHSFKGIARQAAPEFVQEVVTDELINLATGTLAEKYPEEYAALQRQLADNQLAIVAAAVATDGAVSARDRV